MATRSFHLWFLIAFVGILLAASTASAQQLTSVPPPQPGIANKAEQLLDKYITNQVTYQEGADASQGGTKSDCSHFVGDVLRQAGANYPASYNITVSPTGNPITAETSYFLPIPATQAAAWRCHRRRRAHGDLFGALQERVPSGCSDGHPRSRGNSLETNKRPKRM